MKNYALILVAALLTVSASAPVQEASADTTPVIVVSEGSAGFTL